MGYWTSVYAEPTVILDKYIYIITLLVSVLLLVQKIILHALTNDHTSATVKLNLVK